MTKQLNLSLSASPPQTLNNDSFSQHLLIKFSQFPLLSQVLAKRLLMMADYQLSPQATQLQYLIAWMNERRQQGHSALLLSTITTEIFPEVMMDSNFSEFSLESWLGQYPKLIGSPNQPQTPIVLLKGAIGFRSLYQQDMKIINFIEHKQTLVHHYPTAEQLAQSDCSHLDKWQQIAVFAAASLPLCLINGGAGTGKTTTLAKALELILFTQPQASILLAAPTGKAANRLQQSLNQQIVSLAKEVQAKLATIKVRTIHQILGISKETGQAYRNHKQALFCDVLAVDEASMVSGDVFLQLLSAMRTDCRLILLGDEQQLPAVNSAGVFNELSCLGVGFSADFCQKLAQGLDIHLNPSSSKLPNQIIKLQKNYRFDEQSIIASYASSILAGNTRQLMLDLQTQQALLPLETENTGEAASYLLSIAECYPKQRKALLSTLANTIVLCAKREGRYAASAVNAYLDKQFRQILQDKPPEWQFAEWYVGRRIIIEKNNYQLNVFNGDIGYCDLDQLGQWRIRFEHLSLPLTHLSQDYSLAFAISIHKSQGSEYDSVKIVLDNQASALLNRALLYTAVTRAKQSVQIYAEPDILLHCVDNTNRPETLLGTYLAGNY